MIEGDEEIEPGSLGYYRLVIRGHLLRRDMGAMDMVAFNMGIQGWGEEYELMLMDELAAVPHEIQRWWTGTCNCQGQLN